MHDGAIVYDRIHQSEDLPVGWTDEQSSGIYRLRRRDDQALFGFAVGPHSWKRWLFPPALRLWQAIQPSAGNDPFTIEETPLPDASYALIGARACELAAIAVQDCIFLGGLQTDPYYRAIRERLFLLAVNCTQPGGICFCASMQTGPRLSSNFDLALTEVLENGRHYFVVLLLLPGFRAQAQESIQARLQHAPRHQEWMVLTYEGRAVHTFVVYPQRDMPAPAVVLIHKNQGLSDWVWSVADQLA